MAGSGSPPQVGLPCSPGTPLHTAWRPREAGHLSSERRTLRGRGVQADQGTHSEPRPSPQGCSMPRRQGPSTAFPGPSALFAGC